MHASRLKPTRHIKEVGLLSQQSTTTNLPLDKTSPPTATHCTVCACTPYNISLCTPGSPHNGQLDSILECSVIQLWGYYVPQPTGCFLFIHKTLVCNIPLIPHATRQVEILKVQAVSCRSWDFLSANAWRSQSSANSQSSCRLCLAGTTRQPACPKSQAKRPGQSDRTQWSGCLYPSM